MRYPILVFCALFVIGIGLIGCDSAGGNDAEVTGTYEATTFTLEISMTTYDVLEAGGSLRMTLQANGTVDDGQLVAPCSLPEACEPDDGEVFEATFGGIYEVDGNTVTFDHRTDTFIRNVEWTYQSGTLRTAYEDGGARIVVVLTRQ